jgi:hypothetical protein
MTASGNEGFLIWKPKLMKLIHSVNLSRITTIDAYKEIVRT